MSIEHIISGVSRISLPYFVNKARVRVMLILSRKPGESLIIGENGEIKITILSMKSNQTRIGIDAPKDISVHREEIYQRIHNKNSQEINDESGKDK